MSRKPMDCASAAGRLKAWLDGEVDPGTAEDLARHVADCPACRSIQDDYRAIGALLCRAAEAPAPEPRLLRIRRGVEGARRERLDLIRLLRRVTAAAAAILIISAAFFAWDVATDSHRRAESASSRHDVALEIVFMAPSIVNGY